MMKSSFVVLNTFWKQECFGIRSGCSILFIHLLALALCFVLLIILQENALSEKLYAYLSKNEKLTIIIYLRLPMDFFKQLSK